MSGLLKNKWLIIGGVIGVWYIFFGGKEVVSDLFKTTTQSTKYAKYPTGEYDRRRPEGGWVA